jgi:hypothetical protein
MSGMVASTTENFVAAAAWTASATVRRRGRMRIMRGIVCTIASCAVHIRLNFRRRNVVAG